MHQIWYFELLQTENYLNLVFTREYCVTQMARVTSLK
jgi:hypothetical protein